MISSTDAAAVHGRERQLVVDDVADRGGIHALEILEGMDRRRERAAVDVPGHRALQDDAQHTGVVVHGDEPRLALLLGECGRPRLLLEAKADLRGRARLAADVHRHFLVLADADRDETSDGVRRGGMTHTLGHAVENTVADGSAVQKSVVLHYSSLRSSSLPSGCRYFIR